MTPEELQAPKPAGVLQPDMAKAFDFGKTAQQSQMPSVNVSENATVSGQLEKLLAKDSPYIQAAKTRALQDANARGLANSSMAAGAGVLAATQAALPVAQQDASTYSGAERANTQFGMDNAQLQYRGILDQENQLRDIGFRKEEADKSRSWQSQESSLDRQFKTNMAAADFSRELERMGFANKLEMARVPVQFATSVAQQLQSQVSAIMADPSLSPEAKRNAITNFVNYSNATMSWAERFYGGTFSRFSPTEQAAPPTQAQAAADAANMGPPAPGVMAQAPAAAPVAQAPAAPAGVLAQAPAAPISATPTPAPAPKTQAVQQDELRRMIEESMAMSGR